MKRQMGGKGARGKRGVALIVVLGFLSIMILMAVAFLTQARMERLVAGVSLDAHRGRQMARTAIHAAMSDYSDQLYNVNKYMLPPKDSAYDLFVSMPPYASGEFQSGANSLSADGLEIMQGEARNWIPRRYLEFEDAVMDDTRWILVRKDPSAGAGANNPIIGRYAYLCFDMSGGIDANLVAREDGVATLGNATNRTSVRALGLGELPEMDKVEGLDDPPDASLFKRLRRGWHGFDTMAELILLTNGRYNGGENRKAVTYNGTIYYYIDEGVSADELPPDNVWGPPGGGSASRWRKGEGWTRIEEYGAVALNSTNVSDLVPYSLASYRGWEYNPNTAKWATDNLVAWDEVGSWGLTQWGKALGDLTDQFPEGEVPDWWLNAVNDYTNSLTYPQNVTNYPSPKNVPMINEVSVEVQTVHLPPSGTIPPGTAEIDITVRLQVEWWFPFPAVENDPKNTSYSLNVTVGGGPTATGPAGVDIWIPMRGLGNQYTVEPWQAYATTAFQADYSGGVPQLTATLQLKPDGPVQLTMTDTNLPFDATVPIQIAATTGEGIEILTGGHAVDWIPASVLDIRAQQNTIGVGATEGPFYWEVSDPRLNHLKEGAWAPGDGTMGSINVEATSHGFGTNHDSTNFYCRNSPMQTPVEVSYLSTGQPWKTLEFCNKEGADALSRIVSQKMVSDVSSIGVAYTNGTINPNTSSSNVLYAAFKGLKFKDGDKALDDAELQELVQVFMNTTGTKKITDNSSSTAFTGACMRGLDWIWAKEFQANGYFGLKWGKNARHRLIERTWGLFNPNNSMFTVLAVGQVVREGQANPGAWDSADDLIVGERRAVALVWRDPTPPGLGKPHEMFIRIFKFLDE